MTYLFCITYESPMRFLTMLFRCLNSKARILQSAYMFVLFTLQFEINSLKLVVKYSVKKKRSVKQIHCVYTRRVLSSYLFMFTFLSSAHCAQTLQFVL